MRRFKVQQAIANFIVGSLLLMVIVCILWGIGVSTSFQFFGGMVSHVNTNNKVVALTFEGGPSEKTDKIIQTLNNLGIKATFFLQGSQIEKYPEETKKLVMAGEEIGNFSYSGNNLILKSPAVIRNEIEKTDKLIRQAGYKGTIFVRPPNGIKLVYLPYYLHKSGRKTIVWNIYPEQYPYFQSNALETAQYSVHMTKPGSIIALDIMDNEHIASYNAVPGIVKGLESEGYKILTVSELLKYQNK